MPYRIEPYVLLNKALGLNPEDLRSYRGSPISYFNNA